MRERDRRDVYRAILSQSPALYRAAEEGRLSENDPVTVAACYALAPALGAFTAWLLKNALKSGKKRLYFLARDGYFMLQAAGIFCKRLSLPLECRYLSLSRYSLRQPLFHLDGKAALDAVCRGGLHVTMEGLLRRAGLLEREIQEITARLDIRWDRGEKIPYNQLPLIRRALERCPLFLERMAFHSREALPGLLGYLRQEGLAEDGADAIVDSGWTGSMQKYLEEALTLLGRRQGPEGYYFGLYELPAGARSAAYHWFLFGPDQELRKKVYFNNCLFEALYTAPHGMTLGYEKSGNIFHPVYGRTDKEKQDLLYKLEKIFTDYMERLAALYLAAGGLPCDGEIDRETTGRLLRLLMIWPIPGEAAAFGRLPFSDDVWEGGERELAAPLTEADWKANRLLQRLWALGRRSENAKGESAWPEGSAVRFARCPNREICRYNLYKYLRFLRKEANYRRERSRHG